MFNFFKKKKPKRINRFNEPFFLQWHITDRCNLQCLHCYREDLKKDLPVESLKLILKKYSKLLDFLGKKGRIQFAGGEPFLSEHLFEIIKESRKLNLPSRVLSNGTVINEMTVKGLLNSNTKTVQISIEGTEETHDHIRGQGSFKKVIKSARLLRESGIEVTFSVTVCRLNINELEEIAKLASEHANRLGYHRLIPYGEGKKLSDQLLNPDEIKLSFDIINNVIKPKYDNIEIVHRDPLWRPYFTPDIKCNGINGCSAGYNGLCIEANGDVYPCRRLPIVIGNALTDCLIDIWNCDVMKNLRDRDKLKGKCSDCNLRWLCGGCRAIPYALDGDYLGEDVQCFKSN